MHKHVPLILSSRAEGSARNRSNMDKSGRVYMVGRSRTKGKSHLTQYYATQYMKNLKNLKNLDQEPACLVLLPSDPPPNPIQQTRDVLDATTLDILRNELLHRKSEYKKSE